MEDFEIDDRTSFILWFNKGYLLVNVWIIFHFIHLLCITCRGNPLWLPFLGMLLFMFAIFTVDRFILALLTVDLFTVDPLMVARWGLRAGTGACPYGDIWICILFDFNYSVDMEGRIQ